MTFLVDGTLGGTFPSWTTATRPASPAVGQMGYNTTTANFDQYTASGWVTTINSSTGVVLASQMPTGSVIQVVQAVNSTPVTTSSSSFITTGLTGTITPQFSSSKILVMLSCEMRTAPNTWMQVGLFKNGSALVYINTGLHYQNTATITTQVAYSYTDSPATTSATTYAVYFNSQTGGSSVAQYCPDGVTCTINLLEIRG